MPNRLIKETIQTSRTVNSLTNFEFRVFVYLITYADDFGRGSADPELLRGKVFTRLKGITESQIAEALHSLETEGMLDLYEVDGERYFQFRNWRKHQIPRAKISKFPAPCMQMSADCMQMNADECTCMQMNANDMDTRTRYSNNILDTRTRTRYSYTGTNSYTENLNSAEQREKLKTALLAIEEGGA